eukprot:gene4148-50551_t
MGAALRACCGGSEKKLDTRDDARDDHLAVDELLQ